MTLALSILAIAGLIFLFLAALGVNFPRLSSGWFGLFLIYLAAMMPGWGMSVPVLLVIIVVLLAIIVVVLLTQRKPAA